MISPCTAACARAAARVVLAAALMLGAAASPAADSGEPPGTATDCQNLLHQFDVAWPAHQQRVRAPAARRSRDLGEVDCRAGRYADGVHHLRRALHDIGVQPVKAVALAPRP